MTCRERFAIEAEEGEARFKAGSATTAIDEMSSIALVVI